MRLAAIIVIMLALLPISDVAAQEPIDVMAYRVKQNERLITELKTCNDQVKESLFRLDKDISILKSQTDEIHNEMKDIKNAIMKGGSSVIKDEELPSLKEIILYVLIGGGVLGGGVLGGHKIGQNRTCPPEERKPKSRKAEQEA